MQPSRKPYKKPERKIPEVDPRLKQGHINPLCKGCSRDYVGYCLAVPFEKPECATRTA